MIECQSLVLFKVLQHPTMAGDVPTRLEILCERVRKSVGVISLDLLTNESSSCSIPRAPFRSVEAV
jgi:hypothetical protein